MSRAPADVGPVLAQVPWRDGKVALVRVGPGNLVAYAKNLAEKWRLLDGATPAQRILVCWPGRWSQDVFELADPNDRAKVKRWLSPGEHADRDDGPVGAGP